MSVCLYTCMVYSLKKERALSALTARAKSQNYVQIDS